MSGQQDFVVTMLGTRGSVPVTGAAYTKYGGATGCVRVRAGDQEIFLDAGSGIVNVPLLADSAVSILLSHPHLDHLIGLPFFAGLSQQDRDVAIYLKMRNGLGLSSILRYLFTPPLWPLGIFDYPARVTTPGMPERFTLGEVEVDTMEGAHPGGVTVFKLSYRGRALVYASDFEHGEGMTDRLIAFAKGVKLLIYDGQYTDEEYERCVGYGHSTARIGIAIARAAGVERLWITHHAPDHTDAMLDAMEEDVRRDFPAVAFARCGQEMEL